MIDEERAVARDVRGMPAAGFGELYFGGLESIGFGRCEVTLSQEQS